MELLKLGRDSMFQRIKSSYIDETFELKPSELAKKERLEKIWSIRCDRKFSPHQTIKIIMRDFKTDEGNPISRATAYRDYSWSMAIFGDIDQLNKAAEKMVLAQSYWEIYQKAMIRKDGDLAMKALNSYERLMGFDKEESLSELLKYKSVDIKLQISSKQKKAFDQFFKTGVADFNDFDADDIEYEEVNEDDDDQLTEDE